MASNASPSIRRRISQFFHPVFYYLLLFLRGSFFVMDKINFLLIMIGVGWYGFVVNDQGLDMMAAFGDELTMYLVWAILFLAIWATALCYVARIVLHAANLKTILHSYSRVEPDNGTQKAEDILVVKIDTHYKKFLEGLSEWVPRILVWFPYAIFLWGYIKVNYNAGAKLFVIVIIILLATIHFFFLRYRTSLIKRMSSAAGKARLEKDLPGRFILHEEKGILKSIIFQRLKWFSLTLLILGIVVFAYAWYSASFAIPGWNGKPGLIILTALIVYSLLGLFINTLSNLLKFPLLTLVVILAILICLPRNNNHRIEITDASPENRMTDEQFFLNWVDARLADSNIALLRKDTLPILLIAAEGGGIRACYWTVQVLKQLYLDYPHLYGNTFAATGASGGSVGISFFYNYLFEQQDAGRILNLGDSSTYMELDTIAASDFLSGVTYGFAFPDLLQRFLPWKIGAFDRARFLGNSFKRSFDYHCHRNGQVHALEQRFDHPWRNNNFQRPALLLNSLYVEQGQKAIFSPYRLSENYYADVLDIIDSTNLVVTMKEGMVSSARFPVITPPGLMMKKEGLQNNISAFGHLVDGGYFENTAIQTAQQTALMILKQVSLKRIDSLCRKRNRGNIIIKPIILAIQYGNDRVLPAEALGRSYELAPVAGGANTLFRWFRGTREILGSADSTGAFIPRYIFLRRDNSKKHSLPLGWYLSNISREIIKAEAAGISIKHALGL